MIFKIHYHEAVVGEDIPKLSREWKNTIRKAIEEKLTSNPEIFGKPLRQSLKGYRKLRVGDYRIVFHIQKNIIKVFAIQHRSVIYKMLQKII